MSSEQNPVSRQGVTDQEFRRGTQELPCERPPQISQLTAFLDHLRSVNADGARELTKTAQSDTDDELEIE